MWSWIAEKVRAVPEFFAFVREAERLTREKADSLPFEVNREVLVLLPKARLFEWLDNWETPKTASIYKDDADRIWSNSRAFLIPVLDESEIESLICRHKRYFLNSFVKGFLPKEKWPWIPAVEEFGEWYEPRVVGWGPWDLTDLPLIKEPDLGIFPVYPRTD